LFFIFCWRGRVGVYRLCQWAQGAALAAAGLHHSNAGLCLILLIEDLDRPTTGFITVSQQPMVDTAARIAAYVDQ
jgi:hypothetical protein